MTQCDQGRALAVHKATKGRTDLIAMALIIVAVMLGVAGVAVAEGRVAVADEARFGVQAHQAATNRPLLGDFTTLDQFGGPTVRQPGPLAIYSAFGFVRAFGLDRGLMWFALVVNGASALAAVWAVRRNAGRRAGRATMLAILVAVFLAMDGTLGSALNPNLVVVPMLCSCLLAWTLARGATWVLPGLVLTASFVATTHVAYSLVPLLVILTAGAISVARRRLWPETARRDLIAAIALAHFLWAPTFVDQVFGTGNLGRMLDARITTRGLAGSIDVLGTLMNLPPRAFAGPFQETSFEGPDATGLLMLAGVVVLAWQRRQALRSAPEALVGIAGLIGAMCTGFLTPPQGVADYDLRWMFATGVFVALVVWLTHLTTSGAWERPSPRWSAMLSWGVIGVLAVGVATAAPPEIGTEMEATTSLTADLAHLRPHGDLEVTTRGGNRVASVGNATVARLALDGGVVRSMKAPTGTSVWVLAQGAPANVRHGTEIARWTPATTPDRDTPTELVQWLNSSDEPIVLTESGAANLVDHVDGTAPSICLAALRMDPDRLLDLPAGVLAGLYANLQVASPTPPEAIRQALVDWDRSQPIVAIEVPVEDPGQELVLSHSSC